MTVQQTVIREANIREAKVTLDAETFDIWEGLLNGDGEGQKNATVIDERRVEFDNGFGIDIRLIEAEPTPYLEFLAVDENGCAFDHSQPLETLTWSVTFDLDTEVYKLSITRGDESGE
jgi:hypothetical protein